MSYLQSWTKVVANKNSSKTVGTLKDSPRTSPDKSSSNKYNFFEQILDSPGPTTSGKESGICIRNDDFEGT